MRAILIHIVLRHEPEYSQVELTALLNRLPEGSRRVLHAGKTIGILTPHTMTPAMLAPKLRSALAAFEDWTVLEVGGYSVSKNGTLSPFETWMDDNVRVSKAGK